MIVPRLEVWVDSLAARFPEFVASTPGWYPDLPYSSFGSFAIYIRDRIRTSGIDDVVLRAFAFINEMGEAKDIAVEDLVVAGFLEVLCDEDDAMKAAEAHLTGKVQELLREYILSPATAL